MRDYSQFRSSFWTGETGKKLRSDPDAQRLAIYLFTSPHANVIGFYWLPVQYAHMELGMPVEVVLTALRSLSEMGFAHYDHDLELVWVVNMAREQLGLSDGSRLKQEDNRGKSVRKAAETVKRSALYPKFHQTYAEAFGLTPLQGASRPPSKGLTSASEEQNKNRTRTEQINSPDSLGADAPPLEPDADPPVDEPAQTAKAVTAEIAALEARYRAPLPADARKACALRRRNGQMANTVWLATLRSLDAFPVQASESAMTTFLERYADGEKDERYLLGIARGNAESARRAQPGTTRGPLRPAPAEAFNPKTVEELFGEEKAS
jgi:hypothetical protein